MTQEYETMDTSWLLCLCWHAQICISIIGSRCSCGRKR